MGENSKIAWTDHTFNPWWGCAKASEGCRNCYAEAFAHRLGKDCFGSAPRSIASESYWRKPLEWAEDARKAGVRAKVFCASMADVFEDRPELVDTRSRLADLIRKTADALNWLLLTKRPQNFGLMPPDVLALCWLGVTVEDQRAADERIPLLLRTPAAVRFLSCEPLLGPVDLGRVSHDGLGRDALVVNDPGTFGSPERHVDWVILGGESGPRARPFDLAWARSIVAQCREAGVACFVKQMGRCASDPINGLAGHGLRIPPEARALIRQRLRDLDGRDPAEWPADLRVQQWPEVSP